MKPTLLHALLFLDKKPARSSAALASFLGTSQQTAFRWLKSLEREGLVEKNGKYRITSKGSAYVKNLFVQETEIEGVVFTGMGEGKYYLAKEGYRKQFQKALGFKPYPGTLNIRLESEEAMEANRQLRQGKGIEIRGFREKERAYGGAKCYRVLIQNKVGGAIIVPERAHYTEEVVEILAPLNLRKKLNLKDGSKIILKIE
ncbi:DUF120 domain-containing protein [Candidatus Micrarchaeota archaeon]|nr:DUF120 domain-containing protein [Candidatus Micrarchaeota archaeon]